MSYKYLRDPVKIFCMVDLTLFFYMHGEVCASVQQGVCFMLICTMGPHESVLLENSVCCMD